MSGLADLGGKVAIVTGGASGIGKGIAVQLIAEGAQVIIADVQRDAMEETAKEIGAVGIQTDVSDPASVDALARAALDRYGAVHVICNNAGIGPLAPVADLTLDDWRWMIGVNLWGVIHGIRAFVPRLVSQGEGHVVNTASIAGLVTMPGMSSYCVTKQGVVALIRPRVLLTAVLCSLDVACDSKMETALCLGPSCGRCLTTPMTSGCACTVGCARSPPRR